MREILFASFRCHPNAMKLACVKTVLDEREEAAKKEAKRKNGGILSAGRQHDGLHLLTVLERHGGWAGEVHRPIDHSCTRQLCSSQCSCATATSDHRSIDTSRGARSDAANEPSPRRALAPHPERATAQAPTDAITWIS